MKNTREFSDRVQSALNLSTKKEAELIIQAVIGALELGSFGKFKIHHRPSIYRLAAQQNYMPSLHVRTRPGLTNREQQLAGLISQGLSNKEIADRTRLLSETKRVQFPHPAPEFS